MPTIAPIGADLSLALELCALESMEARRAPGEMPALNRAGKEALQTATRLCESTPTEVLTVARMLTVVAACLDQFDEVYCCRVTDLREVLGRAVLAYVADQGMCPDTLSDAIDAVVQARRTLSFLAAIPD